MKRRFFILFVFISIILSCDNYVKINNDVNINSALKNNSKNSAINDTIIQQLKNKGFVLSTKFNINIFDFDFFKDLEIPKDSITQFNLSYIKLFGFTIEKDDCEVYIILEEMHFSDSIKRFDYYNYFKNRIDFYYKKPTYIFPYKNVLLILYVERDIYRNQLNKFYGNLKLVLCTSSNK